MDYETLGVFYMGKLVDAQTHSVTDVPYLYDAKDLTTHAVCVGMTGSGKTGLCVDLLEEAVIDGIPVLAIDPKGDIGNLALTFPSLAPADYLPWIDAAEAARKGTTVEALAEAAASTWRQGLAASRQDAARVAKLRAAADVTIYTPGASHGVPLALLRSFAPPSEAVRADGEALRERVAGAVSSLLALLGLESDPMTGREHVLLSAIIAAAWQRGESLTLADLVAQVQTPGLTQIGVMPLESFYPGPARFNLAMQLNTMLASPAMAGWATGEPLEISKLLWTAEGKPRISIINIAHLDDAARMFVVTSVVSAVVSWMRQQAGTPALRAILYMDEIFGFFPPTANPPSKVPMLTLLKQARAFGLGVVLATQNPVDLDYKGLANAGTWMIGRLQTARDQARLLDGLEGAMASRGGSLDRAALASQLAALPNRAFLMHNVHDDAPAIMQTRFAMSYLAGPLTREQIRRLSENRTISPGQAVAAAPTLAAAKPVPPPHLPELFVHHGDAGAHGVPHLRAVAKVHYVAAKQEVDVWQQVVCSLPLNQAAAPDWAKARFDEDTPLAQPPAEATYEAISNVVATVKGVATLTTALKQHLYAARPLTLFACPALKLASLPGETEGAFRVRLGDAVRVLRDEKVAALRKKYDPKLAALTAKQAKARAKVDQEKAQASAQHMDSVLSVGAGILGAVFGRKLGSVANVSRARSVAKSASRSMKERSDVGRAEAAADELEADLAELEGELAAEVAALEAALAPETIAVEQVALAPRKADIAIEPPALAWVF